MGKDFTFEELVKQLKTGNSWTRKEAAKALGVMKDKRAIESLLSALYDDNLAVRRRSSEALIRIGEDLQQVLLGNFKHKNLDIRVRTKELYEEFFPEQITRRGDGGESTIEEVLESFLTFGVLSFKEFLILIKSKDEEIRNLTYDYLKEGEFAFKAYEYFEELILAGDKEAIIPYIETTARYFEYTDRLDEQYIKEYGEESRSKVGGWGERVSNTIHSFKPTKPLIEEDFESLFQLLRYANNIEVIKLVIWFLGYIGDKCAIDPIIERAKNEKEKGTLIETFGNENFDWTIFILQAHERLLLEVSCDIDFLYSLGTDFLDPDYFEEVVSIIRKALTIPERRFEAAIAFGELIRGTDLETEENIILANSILKEALDCENQEIRKKAESYLKKWKNEKEIYN